MCCGASKGLAGSAHTREFAAAWTISERVLVSLSVLVLTCPVWCPVEVLRRCGCGKLFFMGFDDGVDQGETDPWETRKNIL